MFALIAAVVPAGATGTAEGAGCIHPEHGGSAQ
jgi:hypothetical protein